MVKRIEAELVFVWLVVLGALAVFLVASSAMGCTAAEAKTALDVSGAVCIELEKQPEPAWVTFACSAIGLGGAAGPTFLAKVKKEDAPVFAARHCPSAAPGKVAP